MRAFSLLMSFCVLAAVSSIPAQAQEQDQMHPRFFIGSWGVVAFNDENDLMKMASVARGYCGIPYHIRKKSDDSFTMYVEDKLKEVRLHSQNNTHYIVPVDTPNNVYEGAREVRIINDRTFTLEYLESGLNSRYGKNVFVRCR